MNYNQYKLIHIILVTSIFSSVNGISNNISCYQCVQYSNKECGPEAIQPCPEISDRCVTHIIKNKQQGFVLKRECGLGPCKFDDEDMNRGLGWNICDRTKDEYFCVFCCTENACNKNGAALLKQTETILSFLVCLFFYLC